MIQANCYIVADEKTHKALIVDPGGDAPVIARRIDELKLQVEGIVVTHGHFDHVEGLMELKKRFNVPVYGHPSDFPLIKGLRTQGLLFGINVGDAPTPDRELADGTEIVFGGLTARILHTPGHSPGSVCVLVGDKLLSGDLLFAGSIGRTDLQGGNYNALIEAVRAKVFTLPDETGVFPGHGPATTVGFEKRTNPFFR
jgi:glyoxylase-like metal-dependent hydrolase (beta-lactamase superfamily II)